MTEIEQLREEIAKLRERVAILEASKGVSYPRNPLDPIGPGLWPINPYVTFCKEDTQ